jgi:hypothetical protein
MGPASATNWDWFASRYPGEKEVVSIVASSHDADSVMNQLIDVGKLDQPGKGFIYVFPIRKGLVNMRVQQGIAKQAASMDQIVVAIDELLGSSSWRAKGASVELGQGERDDYLRDLVSLTFTCDGGNGEALVKIGMQAGAPGATTSYTKYVCDPSSETKGVSPARDVCNMILGRSQVEPVVSVMEENGALDDSRHGQFCVSPVPKAFTFIEKSS